MRGVAPPQIDGQKSGELCTHPEAMTPTDKLIRNPVVLSPNAIYSITVDHWERRHQWSIEDVKDLTEALMAASYADRTEHAKAIRLQAEFQAEAARRWGLAPGHGSHLFSRDLELDPHTILPKAWFTDVLDNFLPDLESSHYPMVEGKKVTYSEGTLPTGTVLENDVAAVVRLGVPPRWQVSWLSSWESRWPGSTTNR